MRAVVDRHGASLQVAPDARARREAHGPRRRTLPSSVPAMCTACAVTVSLATLAALGDREVAAERHVSLDVTLDDEVPVALDAPANARGAADAGLGASPAP